jgi:hypothetical protein
MLFDALLSGATVIFVSSQSAWNLSVQFSMRVYEGKVMTKSTVVPLFGSNGEPLSAEAQAIREARGQCEAEMQADLAAQERARLSAHARMLAQTRATTEMELAAQLKINVRKKCGWRR